jgi:hypothetical protein
MASIADEDPPERVILQPVIQPVPVYPAPAPSLGFRCPACGLDFSGTMGYVCGSQNCPIQVKITCTGAGTSLAVTAPGNASTSLKVTCLPRRVTFPIFY